MNDFKKGGPGGLRGRKPFMGGRPSSDAAYGAKKKFEKKPSFGGGKFSGKGDRGGDRPQMQLHKATCSNCKKSCEVPFKPDGTKPVLCRDCFANKSGDVGGFERRDRFSTDRVARKPERTFDATRSDRGSRPDFKALTEQIRTLESKMHEVLELLKETSVQAPVIVAEKKPKKEAVAKKVTKKTTPKTVKKITKKK